MKRFISIIARPPGSQQEAAGVVLGFALACALTAAVLEASGAPAFAAMVALAVGALGGTQEMLDTLRHATPLMFTGLATVVAYRARYWTLGQEGQILLGALFAYLVAQSLPFSFPRPFSWMVPLLASAIAGAIWSMFACWLFMRFQTSEIISTMMLNFIALYLVSYFVGGPLAQSGGTYLETSEVRDNVLLPVLNAESGITASTVMAFALAVCFWLFMRFTSIGYEIRAVGESPRVAQRKGISLHGTYALVALLSGAAAGLCGAMLLLGGQPRLSPGLSAGVGYAGIIVAMLAQLNPIRVIFAALLFGGLESGGAIMQLEVGVSSSIVHVIQALFLIAFLIAQVAIRYRVRLRLRHA